MNERAQYSHCEPARNGRRSDGSSAAMTAPPQHTRAEHRDRNVGTRKPEDLQRPLCAHDPRSIQSTREGVELSIEHRRLVDECDESKGAKRNDRFFI